MDIPETLSALSVPISGLKPYSRNARQGDVGVIVSSLERLGQFRPIVVNARTSEVLAGNHTLRAAQELGWQEIAATFVDVDEDTAARINLADNRANDLAAYDDHALADLLQSLPDFEGTGFDGDALDDLLADLGGSPKGDERYTPGWIFDAMGLHFDLDVSAPVDVACRLVPASRFLTINDDGLTAPWDGLVWMNPPYSGAAAWARRWLEHPDGVCLMPMSEAQWTPDLLAASAGFVLLPAIDFVTPFAQTEHIDRLVFLAGRGAGEAGVRRLASERGLPLFAVEAGIERVIDAATVEAHA